MITLRGSQAILALYNRQCHYFSRRCKGVLTVDIVGREYTTVNNTLHSQDQCYPAVEDTKCPVAPSGEVNEGI